VVRTIREGDRALVERMEKLEQQLRDTAEKVRASEERMTVTTVGYETLEARVVFPAERGSGRRLRLLSRWRPARIS
jgi:hypothetical protein